MYIGISSCYGGWEVQWSLSANWRRRKATGIIQSEAEALRTRGLRAAGVSTGVGSPKNQRPNIWGQTSQLKKSENLLFRCLFVLFGSSVGWMIPAYGGKGRSLLNSTDPLLISFGNTLTNTPRNNTDCYHLGIAYYSQFDTELTNQTFKATAHLGKNGKWPCMPKERLKWDPGP